LSLDPRLLGQFFLVSAVLEQLSAEGNQALWAMPAPRNH
jgi:hypothetical protein